MKIDKIKLVALICILIFVSALPVSADNMKDTRIFIELPNDAKEKMLFHMRDHILALDEIIHAVRAGEYEKAQGIAESRLGWSSFIGGGDQELADHLPKPMQKMAEQMGRAGSNFVILAHNASVEESKDNYMNVIGALSEVTSACRGCHETYRLR